MRFHFYFLASPALHRFGNISSYFSSFIVLFVRFDSNICMRVRIILVSFQNSERENNIQKPKTTEKKKHDCVIFSCCGKRPKFAKNSKKPSKKIEAV